MIPGTNAELKKLKSLDGLKNAELQKLEKQLDEEFEFYKPSTEWILKVAELLKAYKHLSGKDYEIKTMEDSII